MVYFLDTNSIIYFLKGAKELDAIFESISKGKDIPLISVITKIELLSFPGLTVNDEAQIKELLDNFEVIGLSNEIAEAAIKIRKQFHLKVPDAIIAASCLVNKGILVTRDKEGFGKIKAIRILNPFVNK